MLTVREMKQRASVAGIRITRPDGSTDWRVTLMEWTPEEVQARAYYTDDREDALLTGQHMRRESGRVYNNPAKRFGY